MRVSHTVSLPVWHLWAICLAEQLPHLQLVRAVPHTKRMKLLQPWDSLLCRDLQPVHMPIAKAPDVSLVKSLH